MYSFLVNPHSRSGLGASVWETIEPVLKEQQVEYQVFFTQYQRHATRIVHDLTKDLNTHTLVVLGGDGTINEVLNGIVDFSLVTLGYIPIGSSNDFARDIGLPSDPLEALKLILNPTKIQAMDVGLLTYRDRQKRRYFAVSTGLGFDAAICHQAVVSRLKVFLNKLKLGKLTYVGIALNRLFYNQPVSMKITVDSEENTSQTFSYEKVYFAAVMNHRYEGGGCMFCPKADATDGVLDLIVVSRLPKWKILILLPTAFFGKHVYFKGIHLLTGTHFSIHSEKALPVHTDGEPIFLQKDIEVTLAPKRLSVISK